MNEYRPLFRVGLYIAIGLGLLMIHIRLSPYAFDDAFIHFRVARNLLDSGAPYFNAGEPVMVSSSSGWVILTAGLLQLGRWIGLEGHFPLLVAVFNAAMLFGGMWVFVWLLEDILKRRLSTANRLLVQMLYLGFLLPSSFGLMETGFALLLAGVGIILLLRSKPWGITLLSISVFVRPELLVLLGLVLFLIVVQKKFSGVQLFSFLALGNLPFILFDIYFYHTLIPQAVIAKPVVYSIQWWQSALSELLFSLPYFPVDALAVYAISGIILIVFLLLTLGAAFRDRGNSAGLWALLFSTWSLMIAFIYILGRNLVFDWYRPLYMIPLVLAGALCILTDDKTTNALKVLIYTIATLSGLFILVAFVATVSNPALLPNIFEPGARVRMYRWVGAAIDEHFPDATLMSSEIGGLGYTFHGEILDALGLASPGALAFHPLKVPEERSGGNVGAIPPGYVRANMPDLIVSYDAYAQALLSNEVINAYNQILVSAYLPEDQNLTTKTTIWGSTYLRIYVRKDLPIPEAIAALGLVQK